MEVVTCSGSLVHCAAEREKHSKQTPMACVRGARSLWATLGLPRSRVRASPVYTAQPPSRLLCRELSKAGPGLRALPRSKPLRFRFSGPPHRRRLGWACVLCPSQARAAQGARCLASAHAPGGRGVLAPPGPSRSVSWVHSRSTLSDVPYVSSGELISDCDPPGGCQLSRIPERLG